MCDYEEALTYPPGSQQAKPLFTQAAKAFQEIHNKYRTMVVGLMAHFWEARCYDALGDDRKAKAIYREIVRLPSSPESLKKLRDQAQAGLDALEK